MKSLLAPGVLVLALTLAAGSRADAPSGAPPPRRTLRVCADPNNLPFSNQHGEGFENKIAERLAAGLGAELQYTWWAQRRGFVRNTLKAGLCDVIIGVPALVDAVAHTDPYYRSTYVFVTPAGRRPIDSFDDPALRRLRVGIALVGDDGANPPPEGALARRGIIDNVVGYGIYGDYAEADPPLEPLRALARGELDVAAVWGPLAGYFARRAPTRWNVTPVQQPRDAGVPLVFDITLGVRRGPRDEELRQRLNQALRAERVNIDAILASYGVPRV